LNDACTPLVGVVLSLLAMNYFVCALKKEKKIQLTSLSDFMPFFSEKPFYS
jgi:hypothetical protein